MTLQVLPVGMACNAADVVGVRTVANGLRYRLDIILLALSLRVNLLDRVVHVHVGVVELAIVGLPVLLVRVLEELNGVAIRIHHLLLDHGRPPDLHLRHVYACCGQGHRWLDDFVAEVV